MKTVSRAVTTVIALGLAAFCAFGFLASFEPGVAEGWKLGYAAAFVVTLAWALTPWISKRK